MEEPKKLEFSKIILCLVMSTYFAGLILGISVITRLATNDSPYIATALCGLFSFIGAPVATAIGFYSYKAKAENVEKIRTTNTANVISTVDDIPCEKGNFDASDMNVQDEQASIQSGIASKVNIIKSIS